MHNKQQRCKKEVQDVFALCTDTGLPIYVSILGHSGLLNSATVASSPVCCCIPAHCSAGEAQVWASWMECSIWIQSGRLFSKCPVCTEPPWWHGSKEGKCINVLHSLFHSALNCKGRIVPVYTSAPRQEALWRSGGTFIMSARNGGEIQLNNQLLYPEGEVPITHWIAHWMDPQPLWMRKQREISWHCHKSNPGYPA